MRSCYGLSNAMIYTREVKIGNPRFQVGTKWCPFELLSGFNEKSLTAWEKKRRRRLYGGQMEPHRTLSLLFAIPVWGDWLYFSVSSSLLPTFHVIYITQDTLLEFFAALKDGNIRLSNFTGPINEYIYRFYNIKKTQMLFICLKDGQQNLRRSFNHLVSSTQNIMWRANSRIQSAPDPTSEDVVPYGPAPWD